LNQIGTSTTKDIEEAVKKAVGKSLADISAASQKLKTKTRKNIFYSAGLTLLLLLVAVGGILFAWKWHDGTKIAEMRIEKMLEAEREDIRKKAVADYKASSEFREDACKEVAENIQKINTLHYLNKYIKSSTVNKYPELKTFYKDFIKSGDEEYKKSQK
jgi:hypothetical protein